MDGPISQHFNRQNPRTEKPCAASFPSNAVTRRSRFTEQSHDRREPVLLGPAVLPASDLQREPRTGKACAPAHDARQPQCKLPGPGILPAEAPGKSRGRQPFILDRVFTRPFARDDAGTDALWHRHFQGDADADHALFTHYAPFVAIVAFRLHRRRPELFDDVEQLISDGSLGLLHAIRLTRQGRGFWVFAKREIRKQCYREMQTRQWGGRRASEKRSVLRSVQATLTAELGRLPGEEETLARLGEIFDNPLVYVGHADQHAMSQIGADGRVEARNVRQPGARPDQQLIDAEVIRLAGKGLDRRDRKILKAILAGQTPKEIADRFELSYSTVRNRINGLLWSCRSNAELAAYVGALPGEMPAANSKGRFPLFPLRLEAMAG